MGKHLENVIVITFNRAKVPCLKITMIVRPQQHWLRRIFVWHGSVLSKIFSRLLLFCTSGNNKQPRKCQQYLPVLLQRILLLQHLMVAFEKMLLFALGQILQPWT